MNYTFTYRSIHMHIYIHVYIIHTRKLTLKMDFETGAN